MEGLTVALRLLSSYILEIGLLKNFGDLRLSPSPDLVDGAVT